MYYTPRSGRTNRFGACKNVTITSKNIEAQIAMETSSICACKKFGWKTIGHIVFII
jgi:hypothetical protein